MFGLGMGRGNPRMRALRIGALILILFAGAVFHHSGPAYDVIRGIYYVAIVGFIIYGIRARKAIGMGGQNNAFRGRWGSTGMSGGRYSNGPTAPSSQPIDTRLVDPSQAESGPSSDHN